ncbi:tRNA (uridine(54)-C5)-methyltransferase TrmA [Thiomicrorhabdus heinhorstiae]|uniref:tRNA/tmRNA (uracil-C(5))-methyltransferase n=1 Tax=Thiomicrorhabdus heinhorstiae TaxID=2748010 RepID=A0ABS0BUJ4_9GAMM|nr:tRNA (uridine(54)-C5)-methyltransferase TrmA [Thiomicrorhabdus heinhorstiae]MBF6057508.1 tRNA (uridine(54)-C5)-methyltransferase TrmA [Thiomicrorhabdus heinhorstiae]
MLCQVFPEQYAQQLAEKVERLQTLLPQAPNLQVFESPAEHYRARAEFRIWHEEDDTFYIMFDQETKQKVRIDECPMAIKPIAELMPKLMDAIKADDALRSKLFQVDFLATLSGQMLVTLIYRRSIEGDEAWLTGANRLREILPIDHIIGRARKQKILLDEDFVTETLDVDGKPLHYQQIENSFTQPNPYVAQHMLHWARAVSGKSDGDLIELYCGNGNFSIALADCYRKVLATEISKTSVASAQINIAANGVENLQIIKMAAEEVTEAFGGREFNRLKGIDLNAYEFSTIFVDPPRSGLDDLTRKMVCDYERIIYISCNPETLARDLEVLTQTHEIQQTALFDQFPYTHHIESGVFLTRKA